MARKKRKKFFDSNRPVDKVFLWLLIALVGLGFFVFVSASLGLHSDGEARFWSVVWRQAIFGLIGGGVLAYLTSRISYKFWHRYAFWLFLGTVILTLLVFIPGLGYSHGGATRWLGFGSLSFQPAEILKIGFVIYFAAWLSGPKEHVRDLKWGLGMMTALLTIIGVILLAQPDTDTLLVIIASAFAMFIVAGGKWKHLVGLGIGGATAIALVVLSRDYIRERLFIFLNPEADPLGAGYQISQSLIAVGSGQWFGRGLGQSVQKFGFVPEPIGDSIFAVFAEEWGFIGAALLVGLFLFFALRGYKIASEAPNQFARLTVVGIVSLIIAQSFINIASMLALFPLTGMPLIFVSHGGSALAISLAAVGIVLNISRHSKSSS